MRILFLLLSYAYDTERDHVLPGEVDEYLAAYRRANDNVGYRLSYSGDGPIHRPVRQKSTPYFEPMTLSDLYPVLYVLLGLAVFITWQIRRKR